MIKDDIKNPERLGITNSIVSGKYGDAAFGIRKVDMLYGNFEIRLAISKEVGEEFHNSSVKAMLITPEKAHALGKALIELSGIKAPKKHYRARLNGKLWYAGQGGAITTDKDLAAIMNEPHAKNVVKKYGGQLVEVDYAELEEN